MDDAHPLRAWRNSQDPKITLARLAHEVGLSPSHISMLENGAKGISLPRAIQIERFTKGAVPASALVPSREAAQ